jgi:hypothetical protein
VLERAVPLPVPVSVRHDEVAIDELGHSARPAYVRPGHALA